MKNTKSIIITAVFLLLIFSFTLWDFLTPDRDFSEWENRALTPRPALTLSSLIEGDFGREYEDYITDGFPWRDGFVKTRFVADMLLGKRESGDVYITEDSLFMKQPTPNMSYVDRSLEKIDSFAEMSGVPTTLLVVPSSTYIYRDTLPAFAPVVNEEEIFSHIKKNIKNAKFIDITNRLLDARENYIYFHTDHHWTSLGAEIGYNAFLSSINMTPTHNREKEVLTKEFFGTLASKSGAVHIAPDTIETLSDADAESVTVWNGVEKTEYSSIYFDTYLGEKDKYSYFLGTNEPLVYVKNGNEGPRLIVFKDSYAHIMCPLMLEDFGEILFVDLRYMGVDVEKSVRDVTGRDFADFDLSLFLYSTDTFTTQYNMVGLKG